MDHLASFGRSIRVFWTVCLFYIKLGFLYFARVPWVFFAPFAGIAPKLVKELAKEVTVRQSWQIFNRGEYKTSTEDWLHPADSKRLDKPKLLTRIFQDPKYRMAEIVIIMLGSYDVLENNPSLTPQETLRNLQLICQSLQRNGKERKSIYLSTIPTAGDDLYLTERQRADNVERNRLILEYVKKNDDGVLPGLDIDPDSNFEMRRGNLYWNDGRHFSDIGYTKMAKDWVPLIKNDMVKREFALFQRDLGL
ncbi:hypothetical protein BGX31_010157 [Mortierella sp. GBA43]|nr:hypothetical protein BGX31_010157 [Mortierella sp. GBA43]